MTTTRNELDPFPPSGRTERAPQPTTSTTGPASLGERPRRRGSRARQQLVSGSELHLRRVDAEVRPSTLRAILTAPATRAAVAATGACLALLLAWNAGFDGALTAAVPGAPTASPSASERQAAAAAPGTGAEAGPRATADPALPDLRGLTTAPQRPAGPATVQNVSRQIELLNHQAEQAAEAFNAVRERLASLKVRTAATRSRIAARQAAIASSRSLLGRIAAQTYMSGDLSSAALFLGDDPDAALAAAGETITLADRRADAVATLAAQEQQLQREMSDLRAQTGRVKAAQAALTVARQAVDARLAAARAQLARLSANQRAQLARTQTSSARSALRATSGRNLPDHPSCQQAGISPGGGRVGKVIAYLCAHLGDPYVWAAAGPRAFDCSGLSQQAWKQAGVSLPHFAAAQSRYGTRVSASALQPGDLVFFYAGMTHMGIAVGDGLMIAAPRTGDVVKIQPINFANLVAATRL